MTNEEPGPDPDAPVTIGLVAAPGPATDLAVALAADLPEQLAARWPGVRWRVEVVSSRLVEPPAELSELIDAARRRLLEDRWQFAVCLTDLPLQTSRRPVVAHASATHGVAVLSLPALGPVAVRRHATQAIVRLVDALLGQHAQSDVFSGRDDPDDAGVGVVARVVSGNLRLLLGMLRANRPWRLAAGLSRALVAAVAAGVFALVTIDIWKLADNFGTLRLGALAVLSVLGTSFTLVISAGLWERVPRSSAREQVVLFNIVTLATVVIGVWALYAALFMFMTIGALFLPSGLLGSILGHRITTSDHLELAWLATSIATVGGGLGAALESDSAVREAAYTYQGDPKPPEG
ncbi:MAG: hypothetical protein JWL83_1743 [Actinomycetia bacterium]|nr:hypothetical protein [Actinomycetes bacterium]